MDWRALRIFRSGIYAWALLQQVLIPRLDVRGTFPLQFYPSVAGIAARAFFVLVADILDRIRSLMFNIILCVFVESFSFVSITQRLEMQIFSNQLVKANSAL